MLPTNRVHWQLPACLLSVLLPYSVCYSQQDAEPLFPAPRQWKLSNGKVSPTEAILVSADQAGGFFQVDTSGKRVHIPWSRLAPEVEQAAKVAWLNRDDQSTFANLRDHLVEFENLPDSKSDTFKILFGLPSQNPWSNGKSFSPYAGLWAAVGLAAGKNDSASARLILNQTIQRIETQREIDPSRHEMTLSSAYNNLAIVYLKAFKGDAAANYFAKAIDTAGHVSPVVRHNAQQLTEYVSDGGRLRLGDSQRTKLLTSIATSSQQGHQVKLPTGWLYSLDFDLPNAVHAAKKVVGLDAPYAGMELVGIGSGVVLTPDLVITSRSVFDRLAITGGKFLVTVCEPQAAGGYRTVDVARMYSERFGTLTTTSVNYGLNRRGEMTRQRFTHYYSVTRRPGEPASEVIALLAPGLRVKPAVISDEAPLMGDTVSLLGYRRGPDLLNEGLQTKVGQVTEVTRVDDARRGTGRKAHIEVDIRIEGGSRGGAMMDGLGAVCGIAFDFTQTAGRGKFFEIESVRRWIDMYVPTAQIDEVDLSTVRDQDLEPRTRSAVVPVFIWAERDEGTSDTFSQVANSSTASGGLYIRDPWCLNCSGTGTVTCLNCSNGIVSRKTRTQVGVNQVTGQPIYGNKVVREACKNCSGRGGFDCQQCTQGKLNFAGSR